jgi:Peptidase family M50
MRAGRCFKDADFNQSVSKTAVTIIEMTWESVQQALTALGILAGVPFFAFFLIRGLPWIFVFIHELGHLLFGLIVGMRIEQFAVGRAVITFAEKSWHFQTSPTRPVLGGWVSAYPTTPKMLILRQVVFIIGGPIASLTAALAILNFVTKIDLNLYQDPAKTVVVATNGVFVLISFLVFVISIFPYSIKGKFDSDGRSLIQCLTNSDFANRKMIISLLQGLLKSGRKPRDFDENHIRMATKIQDDSYLEWMSCSFAYGFYVDTQQIEEAKLYLERAIKLESKVEKDVWNPWLLECAFFFAYHGNDLARAQTLLDEARDATHPAYLRFKAEAAVLLAENRFPEARTMARAGLIAFDAYQKPKADQTEVEEIEAILLRAEQGIIQSGEQATHTLVTSIEQN